MNLYIKIENNQPVGYPIVEENLVMLGIDIANLPETFAVYNKIDVPTIGPYENLKMVLAFSNGVVTEVYHVINMTDEEKLAKQEQVKSGISHNGWVFDEATCSFVPPTPKPEGSYVWDNTLEQWVELAVAQAV